LGARRENSPPGPTNFCEWMRELHALPGTGRQARSPLERPFASFVRYVPSFL